VTCNVGLNWPSLQGSASLQSLAPLSAAFCMWLSSLWTLLGTGVSPRPPAQHCPQVLFVALLRQADQVLGQDSASGCARDVSTNPVLPSRLEPAPARAAALELLCDPLPCLAGGHLTGFEAEKPSPASRGVFCLLQRVPAC